MNDLLLAKGNLDDWIQIIVVVVLFGGPILGAITKKLITVFTPKDEEAPDAKSGDLTARPRTPAERIPERPAPPVGRPLSPREDSEAASQPPFVHSYPPRQPAPVAQQGQVVTPATAAQPPSERPKIARPVRVSQLAPASRPKQAKPVHLTERHLSHLESNLEGQGKRTDDGVERRIGHVVSGMAERERNFDTAIEERLGHVDPIYALPGGGSGPFVLGRPTRQAWRRAIVMMEILGPPVSLRPPDEP